MELVSTPEPHFIPGYTGHCPQYLFRVGKTYGKLTHKLLTDPNVSHSSKLVIPGLNETKIAENRPTLKEIDLIKTHEKESDAVLKFPITPGYDGFIPNIKSKIGERFLAASTAGIAEHENYMQQRKCERMKLLQEIEKNESKYDKKDVLQNRQFQTNEAATSIEETDSSKVPYSKHTPPHFMVDDDPDKFIISGYAGHIPMTSNHFGKSNKPITLNSLNEFSKTNYQHRRSAEWVPIESAGIGSSLPSSNGTCQIYQRTTGMIPRYAGHVPGEIFKIGGTYGKNTINAKRWLEENL